ncbi:FAD-dependent oxidoreductase [Pseudonocardia xinjiangensis]|uniref:FAD-binding protein n=1 Tax=Pseudonocardia xinjiangensis TaxID=75289 RepID=A0ABX1RGW1_9PSEU|nr:FAD-binding protein [Pseudonocardia xinjiangensis]NMH79056.1 FAD-binding protein [Pseudonocardia xinjiangensis]
MDVDLVVAGAGGGLAGALRAAQLGMDVLVVEADEHHLRSNNTSMSTAMIPGAGSRYQRAAGVDDSPERFLTDIAAKTRGQADPRVATALATVSAQLVEWLADHVGMPIELAGDVDYPGHSARRMHTLPGRHGSVLLQGLADAVRTHDRIDLLAPARLVAVGIDRAGDRSAVVEYPDGRREEISARAVLLATNGFGADPDLVRSHLPEIADVDYHGSAQSRGDALRIGESLGAATGCLDAYQGHAAVSAAARTLVTWTTVMQGALVVDREGRRFGDETVGYSEYAALLAARPGGCGWIVLDERINELCRSFTDFRDVVDSGAVRTADTLGELAERTGMSASVLTAEVTTIAAVARGEALDKYGRTHVAAPLAPPYHAVEVVPALFHTQGGLLVDQHAQVLDTGGAPLGGLYASGGAAVGMSGHGAAGYLAGNGLLPALGLAHLAADHLAATA